MQLREDDSISTLDIPPISVFQPILIDDFYQDNLKKHLDESPILGKNYRGEDLGDKDKVLLQFIRLCKALKNKSIESTDAEKKNLQKTFAYILDNVEGDSETKIERKRMFLCFNLLALKPDLVTQLDDITFILNHVGQKNRDWLKTCIIQTLRNRVKELHKEEEQLELQGIVGELQNTLDNLQETISDLQKRPVKAKSVEKALKERLAELNEQIKQLEALEAQLGITKSAGLRVNLEEFHTQLKGYSDAIESDPTDNYENLQSKFNFAGIKRKLNEHKKNGIHDSLLDAAYIASEIANVGLVLQEVVGAAFGERWIEMGMAVGEYSNPIIYGFKAIQRGMKLIGRKYFGLEFADDEVGINPRQNLWDTISATIFIAVTVLLSVGAALAFPLLETAAWLIAPAGLAVVWKSEYGYQNERARDRLENMKTSEGLFDEQDQVEADRIAWHKKVASFALAGVIIFITLGMLASSIVGLPILDQIPNLFTFITIVSGGALAFLALARAGNFLVERIGKEFVNGI